MSEANPRQTSRRRGLRVKRVALVLFFLVVPFAVLEFGARLLLDAPPPHALKGLSPGQMPDDELLWSNSPGYAQMDKHGPINSLGLRGPEPTLKRVPGTTRILSLGESSTFGHATPWNLTYSHLLEVELRRRGHSVEVWNGGVRAWSSVQSLGYLEREITRIDPDLVLFYHEINDFLPTLRGAGLTDLETMDLISGRAWLLSLARSSRLLTHASLAWARWSADAVLKRWSEARDMDAMRARLLPYQRLPSGAEAPARPWMDNPSRLVRVPDPDREAALRRLIALTRAHGVGLVLYHPAYRVSVPHRCLLGRLAGEAGVPLIEVEDLLADDASRASLTKPDYFVRDPYHPNRRGHRVLARGTAEFLERRGLIRRPEDP